jgi:hypothetical protein
MRRPCDVPSECPRTPTRIRTTYGIRSRVQPRDVAESTAVTIVATLIRDDVRLTAAPQHRVPVILLDASREWGKK